MILDGRNLKVQARLRRMAKDAIVQIQKAKKTLQLAAMRDMPFFSRGPTETKMERW